MTYDMETLKIYNYNDCQSPPEIMMLIVPSVYDFFLSAFIISLVFANINEKYTSKDTYIRFVIDFIIIVIPLMLRITILAEETNYLHHIIFITFACIAFTIAKYNKEKEDNEANKRHFITNMRSTISLITIFAILAVDFKIFSSRLGKTLYFGFSLMDVGVGLFVFSNGIVAPELRKPVNTISKSVVNSLPLLIIGVLRLIITKSVDYTVNDTEYGAHWNFFMTLAVTKIFSSIILNIFSIKYSLYIAIFVLTLHEYLLQNYLGFWVLHLEIPRDDIISANREGIVSSLGYVGLYFLSVTIGKIINKRQKNTSDLSLCIVLALLSILFACLTFVSDLYFGVSRRLASTGYCVWIIFIGVFMGLLFLIAEMILVQFYKFSNVKKRVYTPLLIEAINFNGLPFFLVGNLLTGLVNICTETKHMKNNASLLILFVYMFINCSFVTVLYMKNIKLTSYLTKLFS